MRSSAIPIAAVVLLVALPAGWFAWSRSGGSEAAPSRRAGANEPVEDTVSAGGVEAPRERDRSPRKRSRPSLTEGARTPDGFVAAVPATRSQSVADAAADTADDVPPGDSEAAAREQAELVARLTELRSAWEADLAQSRPGLREALRRALSSSDLAAVRAALNVVSTHPKEIDAGQYVAALVQLLETGDSGSRVRAARVLARTDASVDVEGIVTSMTRSDSLNLRVAASEVLVTFHPDELVGAADALAAELLTDSEPLVVNSILGRIEHARLGPLTTKRIIAMVQAHDDSQRAWRGALSRLEQKPAPLVRALLRDLEGADDGRFSVSVGVLSGGVPTEVRAEVVDTALRVLSRSDASQRRLAVLDLLAAAGGDRARRELARLVEDDSESQSMRARAASALERLR